jgi:hypothetical protein
MPVRVKPAPRLSEKFGAETYVPGIPAEGKEIPVREAERLERAGLVVRVEEEPAKRAGGTVKPSKVVVGEAGPERVTSGEAEKKES